MKIKYRLFILTFALIIALSACSTQQQEISMDTPPAATPTSEKTQDYIIQKGDQLDIKFFYNPELNESVIVRPDGKISLQIIDDVQAAGLSPAELDNTLTQKYSKELKNPSVTVIVGSFSAQTVYVGGAVNSPGLIELHAGMTPLQAIVNAGGRKSPFTPKRAVIIRKNPNGQLITIEINLEDAFEGVGPGANMLLKSHDIIHVLKPSVF